MTKEEKLRSSVQLPMDVRSTCELPASMGMSEGQFRCWSLLEGLG